MQEQKSLGDFIAKVVERASQKITSRPLHATVGYASGEKFPLDLEHEHEFQADDWTKIFPVVVEVFDEPETQMLRGIITCDSPQKNKLSRVRITTEFFARGTGIVQ